MDRLRAMEAFAQVVEQQSFAGAGRQLQLPRGVVSKYVQRLETAFGTRLLNRTTRRISLTEAGARMYEHCRVVLAAVQQAQREMDEQRGEPRGRLRIAAPVAFTELYLGPMLDPFLQRYPEVTLDIECSEQFVDLVEGGFDLGVRIGDLPPSSLVARRLVPSGLVVCASPGYLKRFGRPTTFEQLRDHVCLGYAYQASGASWDFAGADGRLSLRITSRHRSNSNHVLRELAVRGHGLVQAPRYLVARDIEAGRLVTVFDEIADNSRAVYVVYPHRQHLPPKVRVFVAYLVQAFSSGALWERSDRGSRTRSGSSRR